MLADPGRGDAAGARRGWIAWMGWAVAAAAIALLFIFPPETRRGGRRPVTGLPPVKVIRSTQGETEAPVRVEVPDGALDVQLFFVADLADEDFPVVLQVMAATGREVFRSREFGREDLLGGAEIPFACDRRDCPDGDYTARVITRDPAAPVVAYVFTLATAPPAP